MGLRDAALMLGLLGAAQFVPLFLLTPVAGVAADRFDRRRRFLELSEKGRVGMSAYFEELHPDTKIL